MWAISKYDWNDTANDHFTSELRFLYLYCYVFSDSVKNIVRKYYFLKVLCETEKPKEISLKQAKWIMMDTDTTCNLRYLPVKLACIIKRNYLMSSNFFFTYRQAVNLPVLILLFLLSTLSDPIWITVTDSPHVNTGSGVWVRFLFIPCRSRISPSWLGAAGFWCLVEVIVLPGSWCQLQMPGLKQGPLTVIGASPPPGHLSPPEKAPVKSHLTPACKTALHWELASQLLHPPLHPPH